MKRTSPGKRACAAGRSDLAQSTGPQDALAGSSACAQPQLQQCQQSGLLRGTQEAASRGSNSKLEVRKTRGDGERNPEQEGTGKEAALRDEESPGCSEMG